ncbi:MAG: DUF4397 domain-containing protein [Myxococcota bacterium]
MKHALGMMIGLAAASGLVGCGGTDCGPGTEERDDECVAVASDSPVTCGDGTTLQNGECVVSGGLSCGVNTTESGGQCVPVPAVCGPGTSFDGGSNACVPDSLVTCGEFTVENAAGECVPAARIQIVHNSADPMAATVDIYVNGSMLVPDLAFRTATAFTKVPANTALEIAVAPGDSASAADAIGTFDLTFAAGTRSYVVAHGVLNPGDFDETVNPSIGFTLSTGAALESVDSTTEFEVVVFHGVTDAPEVDVSQTQPDSSPNRLIPGIEYADFTPPTALPAGVNVIDVNPSAAEFDLIASRQSSVAAALPAPAGVPAGAAALVIASGFANPSLNQDGEALDLLAVLPDGTTGSLDAAARVQVVHNVADSGVATVEVIAAPANTVPDSSSGFELGFREASRFYSVASGIPLDLYVTAPNPTDVVAEALIRAADVTLGAGSTSRVVAVGVRSGQGFDESTNGNSELALQIVGDGTESASDENTVAVQIFHGASDAPQVDVYVAPFLVDLSAAPTVTATYRQAGGVTSVPVDDYVAAVAAAGASSSTADFTVPAEGLSLGGESVFVVASGFLDPAENNLGPAFALAVFGSAGGSATIAPAAAYVQLIHNSDDAGPVDIGIDQLLALNDVPFRAASSYVTLPADHQLDIQVFPSNAGATLGDAITETAVAGLTNAEIGENVAAVAVANGLVGVADTDEEFIAIEVTLNGQRANPNAGDVGLLVFHGGYDAPTVDVVDPQIPLTLVDDLDYGTFAPGFLNIPTGIYQLEVTDVSGNPLTPAFVREATLNVAGEQFVVVASGFLSPMVSQAAFELVAYPSSGGAGIVLPAP